jgi:diaminopimelate epimerase
MSQHIPFTEKETGIVRRGRSFIKMHGLRNDFVIDSKTLKLSVWERPGVLTTACGTGACVAVGAAHRRGLTQARCMRVIMPAGLVQIELQGDDSVIMIGPVQTCYTGYLPVID